MDALAPNLPFYAAWPAEIRPYYPAPILIQNEVGAREIVIAGFGVASLERGLSDEHFDDPATRIEDIATLTFPNRSWMKAQHALVPMRAYYANRMRNGIAVEHEIGASGETHFAVAALCNLMPGGQGISSFSPLTTAADGHPLMRDFATTNNEKRSVIIVPPESYDTWLGTDGLEAVNALLRLYPAAKMEATPVTRTSLEDLLRPPDPTA